MTLSDPMDSLPSEAFRSASTDDIMSILDQVSTTKGRVTPTPRRRGRPPGSKNKTVAEKLKETDPDGAKKAEEAAAREAKKKRAEELERAIYGELNDQLMTVVTSIMNVPLDWIYLPGKGPVVKPKDERFTDIGAAFAIPQGLAHSIGRLAAEIEQTRVGQTVSGVTQDQNVGLIVAGGMTLFGIFQYTKQLSNALEKLKPVIEAQQRIREAKAKGEEPKAPTSGENIAYA